MSTRPNNTSVLPNSLSFPRGIFLGLVFYILLVTVTIANDEIANQPVIFQNDSNNATNRIEKNRLFTFEKELQALFVGDDSPDEVFAVANSRSFDFVLDQTDKPVTPKQLLIIAIYGERIELQWSRDHGKNRHCRDLVPEEAKSIREFVSKEKVDNLPILGSTRVIDGEEQVVVGGTVYVYLHLTKRSGLRVLTNNPPTRGKDKISDKDPVWKYTKVVDFFNSFKPLE